MRREIYEQWQQGKTVASLSREYKISRQRIYVVLERGHLGEFENRKSINERFRTIEYGLKRLSIAEAKLRKKIERSWIKRYEKEYPGQMDHFDTKRLPLLFLEAIRDKREHLHVAIDDYSRFLVADIFPDKSQYSSAMHLEEVIKTAPFQIEETYSDNGSCYRGRIDHKFVAKCIDNNISQKFTRPRTPRTNGKAERVIRTLMEEWHTKGAFKNREDRKKSLQEYVYYYNFQRPHSALGGLTPIQRITNYYAGKGKSVNNA